ncbi:YhfZ family protein [Propionibacteriaceae bacterium Y1923]|uniref:YhfZ family protein n=1 Tax=Aestuariimicrobium sp. Y1814 TaxID=3418742 RepID=UPI003C2861DC
MQKHRNEPASTSSSQQGLGSAMRALAVDALAKGVGGTLVKNTALRDDLGISAGTVQRALDVLADRGALHTVSRGHLGRRIEQVDVGRCWHSAGLDPLRVLLSPAGAVEMDVLESTLARTLTDLGIPHSVRHSRGGAPRIHSVMAGEDDLTVTSAGTLAGVRSLAGAGWREVERVLGPGTYYAPDQLVILRRQVDVDEGLAPARVAIDRDSFDHEALTAGEFGEAPVEFVDINFPEVPAYVHAGVVDAGVWHVTRSAIPPRRAGLALVAFQQPRGRAVRDELSAAAIVGWSGRPELRAVLEALDLSTLDADQRAGFEEERSRSAALEAAVRTQASHIR